MLVRFAPFVLLSLGFGCATTAPAPAAPAALAEPAPEGRVDGATAKKLVGAGAKLVDVREPEVFAREHIGGAINVPLPEVAARAASDIGPVSTPVVVYCRTGNRSAKAAATLRKLGYTSVYDLGSYLSWGQGAPAPTPLPPARAN